MWQMEDLIRAYGCSLSRIKAEYISQFNYSDEQKEDIRMAKDLLDKLIAE